MDWSHKKEKSERSLRLERLDKLLSLLDACWINPLEHLDEIINLLNQISRNISSEFEPEEKTKDKEARDKIKELSKSKKVYKTVRDESFSGNKFKTIFSHENWKELEQELDDYERFLREIITNAYKGFSYTDMDTSGTVEVDDDNS